MRRRCEIAGATRREARPGRYSNNPLSHRERPAYINPEGEGSSWHHILLILEQSQTSHSRLATACS